MLRVLARVARIVRRERVAVVLIGELVYGGWLVAPCRFLLRRKVILYIHGEELIIDNRPATCRSAARHASPARARHRYGQPVRTISSCRALRRAQPRSS